MWDTPANRIWAFKKINKLNRWIQHHVGDFQFSLMEIPTHRFLTYLVCKQHEVFFQDAWKLGGSAFFLNRPRPEEYNYSFLAPGKGPGYDYWYHAKYVPEHLPRYKGELVTIGGSWGSAHKKIIKIPEGGFAVEGPRRFETWEGKPCSHGDWSIFGPNEDRCVNVIPWSLIMEARVEEITDV